MVVVIEPERLVKRVVIRRKNVRLETEGLASIVHENLI